MLSLQTQIEFAIVALALALGDGCAGTQLPELYHPGSAGVQRAEAVRHDPYPLDDVAPPVVGGRPREYERPIPEVERAQMFAQRPQAFQPIPFVQAPAAPIFTPAPGAPPIGAPAAPYPYAAPPPSTPVFTQPAAPAMPTYQVRPPY